MVITSPFSSIRGFVATRPPLVLFTLCLIAFAVTTFTFAYYVEHRSDLGNTDAHRDWGNFLSYLGKRKLCILPNEAATIGPSVNHDNDTGDLITVTVMATLSSNLSFQNVSFVQGYISTLDWVSECPLESPVNQVRIFYNVPHYNNSSNFVLDDVCVSITGPRELVGPAAKENPCAEPVPHGVWNIVNKNSGNLWPDMCNEGIVTMLDYKLSPQNAVVLTLHDRSIINLHLFHTSYFLLVMAITLICYAMIKGKPVVKHQPLDKMCMDA